MNRLVVILLLLASAVVAQAQNEALQHKLENALACVDERTRDAHFLLNDYIISQFRSGNDSEVLRYAPLYLQSRIAVINQMYFALSEQERADLTILVDGDLVFHYILSSAVHTHSNQVMGDVYNYLLYIKQLQLRTSQQISDAIRRSGNQQMQALYEQHEQIRKQLAQSNPPQSLCRTCLQTKKNSLGEQLAKSSRQLVKDDAVSWKDVQKRLGNGEAAIEFVRFNIFQGEAITSLRMYAAVVVTQSSYTPELILMNTEKRLTSWQTDNPGDLYEADKYGAALSQWVWLDILVYLNRFDVTTVFFSPFGILNNMAIESLPYDREDVMSYKYNLIRLSSTRELTIRHNLYPKSTATLYGNLSYRLASDAAQPGTTRSAVYPLPWSKTEVDSISSILTAKRYAVQTFTMKQGTEASFKSLDGKSTSILHVATHGFVNRPSTDDVMQRSGLIMAYGARAWERRPVEPGTEDGILTAAEIASLDLSGTDVVVLSACNSALGEITSEGVWGLQLAFKQAGVQTVVMSLWQVDDEATAVFMQYFYEALMNSRRVWAKAVAMDPEIAEHIFDYSQGALSTAQHRMRQHLKFSSPYYWAAFIAVD